MPEPCDSIGAPAPQQQVVVVSAIVHTNKKDMQRVKIPAFVPLFVHLDKGRPMMSATGVAHVTLEGPPEQFLGISLDEFCADNDKGEAHNHITVAIAGAVTCATPNAKMFETNYNELNVVGKYVGVRTYDNKMEYEGKTCTALGCVEEFTTIGTLLGVLDPAYDGIRLLLQTVPEQGEADLTTGSRLGKAAAEKKAAEKKAAEKKAAEKKAAEKQAARAAAAAAAAAAEPAPMFVDPRAEDAADETIGQKRPAKSSASKKEKARSKKEKI